MGDLAVDLQSALQASLILSAGICFFGGLVASLSPCVYPLLPVVASYVGSRTIGERTRFKAFFLSLAYVLGLAAVYSALGMIAAMTGSLFGSISTNPWAQLIVGNIIILFGLNVLEVIPLPLLAPQGGSGGSNDHRGLIGAFIIGAVSGIVASPCTAPVLGVVLTYVASTQNVVQGGLLLFVFSLGMGLLLIIVGTFSGLMTALPRPGNWMRVVRVILGLAMIGLGEYFVFQAGKLML